MESFRKTVDRYSHRVFTYAVYTLGNREEAQDVTQEVLIRLWKHWRQLDEKSIAAWLTRVTRNACIDRLRAKRAYSMRMAAGASGVGVMEGRSVEPGPDSLVEASELRDTIHAALTKVPEPYRSLIILREIQEMTYQEITEALGLPLNTVKSHLHRGRERLRKQLKEILENDPV